jgi:hypothetical protein
VGWAVLYLSTKLDPGVNDGGFCLARLSMDRRTIPGGFTPH